MKSFIRTVFFHFSFLFLFSTEFALAQPDLATAYFANYPTTAGQGAKFVATYFHVTNKGTEAVDSSWIGFYISTDNVLSNDDILLSEVRLSSLGLGETAYMGGNQLQLPSTLAGGNYWVIYKYDSRNTIAEKDESNNVEALKLTIQAAVFDYSLDLKPNALFDKLPIGIKTNLLMRCYNYGNIQAPSSNVTVYLSKDQIHSTEDILLGEFVPLAPTIGITSAVDIPISITLPLETNASTYFLLFIVDEKNLHTEGNEANNQFTQAITAQKPYVDLSVIGFSSWKDTLTNGIFWDFGFHFMKNNGNMLAKNIVYKMLLSKDTLPDVSDITLKTGNIDSLAIDDERTGFYMNSAIPTSVVEGSYYYLFVLETKGGYPEANSADNIGKGKTFISNQPLLLPSSFVQTGLVSAIQCMASTPQIISCDKKIEYKSPIAGVKNNVKCYFQDIVNISSENTKKGSTLTFESFNVFQDTIIVYDSNVVVGKYTGLTSPGVIHSNSGKLKVSRVETPFTPLPNSDYGFTALITCGDPLGLSRKKKVNTNDFVIFPNPNSGFLFLKLPLAKGKIEILNADGQIVNTHYSMTDQINTSLLPKGTYYVKWSNEETYDIKTLIIN